jgi:hypothetical protein
MSKTSALACVALGSFLFVSAGAWAFPAAPLESKAAPGVILVAEGCGPGYHRGWFGRCRPNEIPRRACEPGWHFSRLRGHCVRNWL